MASNEYEFVSLDIENGVASIVLSRPPLNVIHIPMIHEMEAILSELATDSNVRVLLLRASGKMFSAGVDVADHTPDKVDEMIPHFNGVCARLTDLPYPTIAAVHGHALGGGAELVWCSDFAVMAEEAKIGQPEILLAAMAPVAALRLPAIVGYRTAADIMFTGRSLAAQEALELGLVNAVVPADQVLNWANDKASQLAALSREALRLTKQGLHLGFGSWQASLEAVERLYLEDLMATMDAQEGVAAFMEKRKPVWKHE